MEALSCCGGEQHEVFCPVYETTVMKAAVGVIDAADALVRVTTHSNVTGPRYEERRDYYALLRKTLAEYQRVAADHV
jgi:hypothetical protein